ncbi:MAG: sigma-70 family RNA polymerase sigma factor [Chlorobi bacterium]|jgi:RNA polymerase sigma-70 factor (ECF subfamily)|nr:sigma-70 family RNA polymerase sigma factor [Chlorobiota bacterium]
MSDERPARTPSDQEDIAIVRAVLEGDTNAFALLDRKYRRKLYGLIRAIVGNDDDAEDLLQDTLLKAYRALGSFKVEYSFEKWLFKIASNTCIDYLRRLRFAHESLDLDETDDDAPKRQFADTSVLQPDEQMIKSERHEILSAAIASLPDKYRIVIELRHKEELDYTEIAERLDLPLGTVKAHLFRARQLLLKKLEPYRHLFEP